ncbi:(2Fe-2S)-binding protein [Xanthobacter sp. KR7-225]|uniref:(2Fe-2S)-binding protein n=1 Tax=Xanthobacter sp. KR7-225 TaxID=3156613 RepID=UPI0032B4C958
MFRTLPDLPGAAVRILIDGADVAAREGEPLAAVLLRTAPFTARTTPVTGAPRGPYCLIGACFDCLVVVDGVPSRRACMVPVRAGLRVERQHGRREAAP